MATKGTLNTTAWKSTYGYTRYIELAWERTSFDVIAQTTTIKWTLTGRGTFTGQVQCAPFTVVIDGETVYQDLNRIAVYPDQLIASGTKTFQHNADGTKAVAMSVYAAIYSSSANHSGSTTFHLDTVGIASITSAPNFDDEANPTIKYKNTVGNAISSLQVCISLTGANPDIAYRDVAITGSSYTFNLTDAERKILRAATQGSNTRKVWFYLRNVIDGNIYFSKKEVTYTIINANPTISAQVVDTNGATIILTGNASTLIRYHSTARATMTATPKKEATIKTYSIEHDSGWNSGSEKTFAAVNGNTFAFIVSDSRGNTATETIVAPMVDYIQPTANIDETVTMDTTGAYTLKCAGNYFADTFGYTSAAAANTLTVKYRYKTQGGNYGSWQNMRVSINTSSNTYDANAPLTGLDYRTTYVFQCQVIDKLNTVYSAEITVRSLPVYHWSENDFVFEVPVTFNAGSNLAEYGTWTPTFTTDGVVASYDTRQGWYQKVGNVVTIGWNVKATMNTGFNTTAVGIKGVPYTPAYAAFGGGVAHQIYITGGFCFEGWGIGTSAIITARIQPCNNTTAGNLQISSSANYPTGNNIVMTIAGTISYITA